MSDTCSSTLAYLLGIVRNSMGLSSLPRCDGAEAPTVAARSEKDFSAFDGNTRRAARMTAANRRADIWLIAAAVVAWLAFAAAFGLPGRPDPGLGTRPARVLWPDQRAGTRPGPLTAISARRWGYCPSICLGSAIDSSAISAAPWRLADCWPRRCCCRASWLRCARAFDCR